MLKCCVDQWDRNKATLEAAIRQDGKLRDCGYKYLVRLIVRHILTDSWCMFDEYRISKIDDGDWQGTVLYVIPEKDYQPAHYQYIMTYVCYGSAGDDDTLQGIHDLSNTELPTEQQVQDYMTLCRHLVANIVKPFPLENDEWLEVAKV